MAGRNHFLTPDTLGDIVCRPIWLPGDDESVAVIRGQIAELSKEWNWQHYGTITPEQAAEAWRDVLWRFDEKVSCGMPTGAITAYAGASLPDGYLWCDGAQYTETAYPDLFAVLLDTYGGSIGLGLFNVPDLRERVVVGADRAADLGVTGGASTVSLSENEMPAHTHESTLYAIPVPSGNLTPVTIARLFSGTPYQIQTDSAGNGDAHENMPPFNTLNWIIKT